MVKSVVIAVPHTRLFSSAGAEAYQQAQKFIHCDASQRNLAAAKPLLQTAVDEGSIAAMSRLGRWFLLGIECEPDMQQAATLLHKAAVAGDAEAQFWLGRAFLQGDPALEPEPYVQGQEDMIALQGQERIERGRAVLKEIKHLRKAAKRAKVARITGKPEQGAVADL